MELISHYLQKLHTFLVTVEEIYILDKLELIFSFLLKVRHICMVRQDTG